MAKRRRTRSKKKGMSAAQRLYFGGGRKARRSRRRARRSLFGGGTSTGRYSLNSLRSPVSTLKPAVIGAGGALAVTVIMGKLVPMLPGAQTLLGGRMRYVTQIVAALALAQFGSKFLGGATASKMAEGALTVTMVDVLRDVAAQAGMPLAGMGYYLPGYGVSGSLPPSTAARPAQRVAGLGRVGQYLTGPGASVVPFRRSGLAGAPYSNARFSPGF